MKKYLCSLLFLALITSYLPTQAQKFEWAKAMDGFNFSDRPYAITTDAAGNVYTTGYFQGTVDFNPGVGVFNLVASGVLDIFISKIDINGNFVWAKKIGGTYNDIPHAIAVDVAGNVYTTGNFADTVDFDPGVGVFNLTTLGGFGIADAFISKLDANGNFVWAKKIGSTNPDGGSSIKIDASGNIYTTGAFDGTVDFDPNAGIFNLSSAGPDIFIVKLDVNGNFVWAKKMGGTSFDGGYCIALDISGNIYTSGSFRNTADFDPGVGVFNLVSGGEYDIFISKLDANGNFIWAKSIWNNNALGHSLAVDATGNVYMTGGFGATVDFNPSASVFNLTATGSADFFISKLDAIGNFVWAKSIGGIYDDVSYSIALDATSNIYTTGQFAGTVDFDPSVGVSNLLSTSQSIDTFVSKLDANGNFVWAKNMGTANNDYGTAIGVDTFGNVHVAGEFSGTGDFNPCLGVVSLNGGFVTDIFILKLSPCTAISISPITLLAGLVGTPYTINLAQTGLSGTIAWSVSSGSLPAGLSLAPTTGIITGTLTAAGASSFTIQVTDGCCPKTQNYSFNVTSCVPFALLPSTNFLPDGNVGVPYVGIPFAPAVPVAGTTYKYYKRNAINWQTGLTLDEDTGVISGTPTFSTSIKVVIEAVSQPNNCGSVLSAYTLVIYPDPTTAIGGYLDNMVKISPNPSNSDFNVDFGTINMAKSSVCVYDTRGKVVFISESNSNLMTISLDKFASGIYLLEVKTSKGRITKRLAKQ